MNDINYGDHTAIMQLLQTAQSAEKDIRDKTRECHDFIDKRDGQWEQSVIKRMTGRPRYTFDKCNPVVDQIAGEMEDADFTLRVSPSGGESSEDTAKTLDGLIRNIRNISNAEHVFNQASRSMITGGIDGWEVVQDWVDADAFEQDLFIRKIPNFVDRVWFDVGAEMQDMSDAKYCFVLQTLTPQEYDEKFPEGSKTSVGEDRSYETYWNKVEFITVGRFLYKKPVSIDIVKMSNGKVYRDNEEYAKIKDDLAAQGITEEDRRKRKSWRVYSRLFDGGDWLKEEQKTVFDYLPVVPVYGNFKITNNKIIYRGVVEKLIDPQRVYNYAKSRQIEEGALAPKGKYWGTKEQRKGNESSLATLNTNSDPWQDYNHVEGQPPPFFQQGGTTNPGLEQTAISAANDLSAAANQFNAQIGNAPGQQSGIANELQIQQGNIGSVKYFSSQEVAICQTGKILINAIPRVYDSTRQIRIIGEDGSTSQASINDNILDAKTGEVVEVNNLKMGQYDVVCEVGDAFKSRQKETVDSFINVAAIDPSILQMGADVMLKNMNAPGMDVMAERKRAQLIQSGVIPFDQMNEDEQQQAQQQAQQPPQADPAMMLAAQAEMQKAQAQTLEAQNKEASLQIDKAKVQLQQQQFEATLQGKFGVEGAKLDQEQQKIDLDVMKAINDMAIKIETLEQQASQNLKADIRENQKLANEQANDIN